MKESISRERESDFGGEDNIRNYAVKLTNYK